MDTSHAAFGDTEREVGERISKLLSTTGTKPVDAFHRELGSLMMDECGITRNEAGLRDAIEKIPELRERFWREVRVPGSGASYNQSREEHQTEDGETLRNDEDFAHVSVWEHNAVGTEPTLHKEPLEFEALPLAQRNYKT